MKVYIHNIRNLKFKAYSVMKILDLVSNCFQNLYFFKIFFKIRHHFSYIFLNSTEESKFALQIDQQINLKIVSSMGNFIIINKFNFKINFN